MVYTVLGEINAERMLPDQDSGTYGFGDNPILPCNDIFDEFLPYAITQGISQEVFTEILLENPANVFGIK